jgi:hypothetical protein
MHCVFVKMSKSQASSPGIERKSTASLGRKSAQSLRRSLSHIIDIFSGAKNSSRAQDSFIFKLSAAQS